MAAFDMLSYVNAVIMRQGIQPNVKPLAPDRFAQRFYVSHQLLGFRHCVVPAPLGLLRLPSRFGPDWSGLVATLNSRLARGFIVGGLFFSFPPGALRFNPHASARESLGPVGGAAEIGN